MVSVLSAGTLLRNSGKERAEHRETGYQSEDETDDLQLLGDDSRGTILNTIS